MNGILQTYAGQEGATTAATLARTTLTASGDDLVAAVYEYLLKHPEFTAQEVANLAAAALLSPDNVKVRADKDKVAARVLEAAILARGAQTDSTQVGLLITAIGTVNSGLAASKQLTAAGKEALIAKAIRSTSGLGADLAAKAETLSQSAAGATPNAKRTAFALAVLKLLTYKPQVYDPALATTSVATQTTKGTLIQLNNGAPTPLYGEPFYNSNGVPPSIAAVSDYVKALLGTYSPALTDRTVRLTTAYTLAEGVATSNPAVAGAVFGGLVKDQKAGGSLANDTAIAGLTREALLRPKLAPAIADIVYNGLSQMQNADSTTVGPLLFDTTAVTRGKIASGAIRALPTKATLIINLALSETIPPPGKTVNPKDVTQAGLPAFAAAAAVGNGDPVIAAQINKAVIAKLKEKATAAADLTAMQAIAIAVIKAVAPANPDAARQVALSLFDITRSIGGSTAANPYLGNAARTKLAVDLAKGASTNYTAAGAAVAGVVERSVQLDAGATADLDVTISAAALKAAPKAAVSIAQKVSFFQGYADGSGPGSAASTFAAKLALLGSSANAADIAAGVALTDTTHAGDIVKAVITSHIGAANLPDVAVSGVMTSAAQRAALKKAAFTIAGKVAINVDVEAIGDIAQKVGTLLQPTTNPSDVNLPKISTLGTLATSLAKAINTKPQVRQSSRVDELGELAAVLVTASLAVPGGNTPAALAAIGTNIYKAASAKLLANVGNNAADLKDIAGDIAGAIAQTIALAPINGVGSLTPQQKMALLNDTGTGSLIKLLSTGAKTFAAQVNSDPNAQFLGAFNLVRATEAVPGTGIYVGYVTGDEAIGSNGAVLYTNGKYEIGAVVDVETRIKDL